MGNTGVTPNKSPTPNVSQDYEKLSQSRAKIVITKSGIIIDGKLSQGNKWKQSKMSRYLRNKTGPVSNISQDSSEQVVSNNHMGNIDNVNMGISEVSPDLAHLVGNTDNCGGKLGQKYQEGQLYTNMSRCKRRSPFGLGSLLPV